MSINHLLDTKELDIKAKSIDIDTLTTTGITADTINVIQKLTVQNSDVNPDSSEVSPIPDLTFVVAASGDYASDVVNGRVIQYKSGNIYTVHISGDIQFPGGATVPQSNITIGFDIPVLGSAVPSSIISPCAAVTTEVSEYAPTFNFKPALITIGSGLVNIQHQLSTKSTAQWNRCQFYGTYSFYVNDP